MVYLIRDIDPQLWKRVKVRAAQQGEPIRTVLIRALTAYAAGKELKPVVKDGHREGGQR